MPDNLSIIHGNAGDTTLDATLAGGTVGFADGNATDSVTNGEIGSLTGLIVLQANTTISLAADAPITLLAGATGLKLETKTGDITILAAINAVNLTLSAGETVASGGKLVIAGRITATGTVSLQSDAGFGLGASGPISAATLDIGVNAGGGVSETFSAIIVANLLQSTAGVVGTANFTGSGNSIAAIGSFAVSRGDFLLADTGGLSVTGPLSADNVRLSSATIAVSGSIGAATTVALVAGVGGLAFNNGAVLSAATVDISTSGGGGTEVVGGKIIAGLLQSSAGVNGTVILAGNANTISTLGAIAVSSGDFLLANTGSLAVTGRVTAANISLSSATISVSGSVGAAGNVTLAAGIGGLSIGATGIVSLGGNAVFAGTTVNDGTIQANGGTITFTVGGTLTGAGGLTLGTGASAVINVGVAAGQTVRFLANSGTLAIGAPASFAATVLGMVSGDVIDFTGIAPTGVLAAGLGAGNVLTATRDGTIIASVQLDPTQNFAGEFFHATADGAGTGILIAEDNIPCFVAGTRILTLTGERLVEDLRVGEQVMSAFGGSTDIVWIGHRQVDSSRHPTPEDVWPIRVAASAFGPDLPSRDLFLSPDHAVHVDGVLIPVRYLINSATIAQVEMAAPLYFHIELRQHDVLLAEGLPCESYLDTGNRAMFANAETVALRPNFAPTAFALDVWQSQACAELVIDGPILAARKRALLEQAAAIGHVLNDEPELGVYLDGQALAVMQREGRYEVRLPAWARAVRLLSNVFVPMQVVADNIDARTLGVAIAHITLDGATLALDDPFLVTGWHAPEATARWTSGDAVLVTGGATVLSFEVVTVGRYWGASHEATRLRA